MQRRRRIPNRFILLLPVIAGLLGSLLYRRALGFAFFNDDPTGHFAWMEGKAWWQFFLTSAEYGYYRPVVFATLRLIQTLVSGYNPIAFHALLLLLHGLNTALVWWLAYTLSGRKPIYAWVTALIFATIPFSYEAVIYVASLTHPLLVFWLLLTLLFYHYGRLTGSWLVQAAAFITLLLGLLTHENGLLIPLALVGLVWLVERPNRLGSIGKNAEAQRRRDWPGFFSASLRLCVEYLKLKQLWPHFIPPLLYLPLWFSIPKEGEQTIASLGNLASNAIPFLQTLVYPLLPLFDLDAADTQWLLILALAVVAGSGFLAYRIGAVRLWLFALGWTAAAALPAMLFLSPDYLYGSPRLHYLPAIGIALLWAIPVLWLWQLPFIVSHSQFTIHNSQFTIISLLLSILYTLALALPPLPFINCQVDFYAQTSTIVRQIAHHTAAAPAARSVTFVNLPFFFSSSLTHPDGCPNPYPWTPVGAVVVPQYAQARDFVRFNGGPNRPVSGVAYDGYAPGWATFGPLLTAADLRAVMEESAVYVFDLPSGTFFDLSAAWQPNEAGVTPPLATFGETIDLLHAEVNTNDDLMTVRLRWQIRRESAAPLTTFVHFYDPGGVLLAQHDAPLAEGFVTAALWQPGDIIAELHMLAVPSPLPALGTYPIAVGLYNSLNGERLPATAEGRPLVDDVYVLGTVTVEAEK